MMASEYDTTQANGSFKLQVQSLIEESSKAKQFSYSPYSHFRVGAALLTDDNKVFTGCNVENASYGIAICAERTAVVKAVSSGSSNFKAIAVSTDMDSHTAPCGACRQFLAEFGLDIEIYLVAKDLSYVSTTVRELLPRAFTPKDLEIHKKMKI